MSYRTELPLVFAVGANWPGLYDVETRNGWYKVDTTTESVRCMTPTDTRDYVDDNECPCYIADDVLDIVSGAILRGEVVL